MRIFLLTDRSSKVIINDEEVLISPKFYKQLLCVNEFCEASLCLQFVFVIFWQKEIGAEAAHEMLVKLTMGVDFINI